MCPQHPLAIVAAADHAQRAKQTDAIIGDPVGQAIQLDHIRQQAVDPQILLGGLLADHVEHLRGQIDRHAMKAAPRKRHRARPVPAPRSTTTPGRVKCRASTASSNSKSRLCAKYSS